MRYQYLIPLKTQGSFWKRGQKDGKNQRQRTASRKRWLLDTTGKLDTWIHRGCDNTNLCQLMPDISKHGGRKWAQSPTPPKQLWESDATESGEKLVLFNGMASNKSATLQQLATHQQYIGSTNWIWQVSKKRIQSWVSTGRRVDLGRVGRWG